MKKFSLLIGICFLLLSGYVLSIYSFKLDPANVGWIEVRKNGEHDRIRLSQEEMETFLNDFNALNFTLFTEDLEVATDAAGYKGPQKKFRVFVFDQKGNELADIRIYDEKNISYVKAFDGSFSLGYHATDGILDLEQLGTFLDE